MDGDPEKKSAAVENSGVPDAGPESSPAVTSTAAAGEKSRDTHNGISGSGSGSSVSNNEDPANLKKLDSKVVAPPQEGDLDAALAHLPEHERAILKEQLDIPPVKVNYFTLFRYATKNDIPILILSAIGAAGGGAVMPLFTVRVFSSLFLLFEF